MEIESTVDPIDAIGSDEAFEAAMEGAGLNDSATSQEDAPAPAPTPEPSQPADAPKIDAATTEETTPAPLKFSLDISGKKVEGTLEELQAAVKEYEGKQTSNYQDWARREQSYKQELEQLRSPKHTPEEVAAATARSLMDELRKERDYENMTDEQRHQFEQSGQLSQMKNEIAFLKNTLQQQQVQAQRQQWAETNYRRIQGETDALFRESPEVRSQPEAVQLAMEMAVNSLGTGKQLTVSQAYHQIRSAMEPVIKEQLNTLAEQAKANKEGALAAKPTSGAAAIKPSATEEFDILDPDNDGKLDAAIYAQLNGR